MIISASRRTDIPNYYCDYFFKAIKNRQITVKNPMNARQIKTVSLAPEDVDGIVFWTKNPQPMTGRIGELEDYSYYFQFTLNGYGEKIEKNIPDKKEIIAVFKKLADKIGPEKVIWRYDPILLSNEFNISYHLKNFEEISSSLEGFCNKCFFSFIDIYKKIKKTAIVMGINDVNENDRLILAEQISAIAASKRMSVTACCEEAVQCITDINKSGCINAGLLSKISGKPIPDKKDKNQRKGCLCSASIDIGSYRTCHNGCIYCYAK